MPCFLLSSEQDAAVQYVLFSTGCKKEKEKRVLCLIILFSYFVFVNVLDRRNREVGNKVGLGLFNIFLILCIQKTDMLNI